MSNKNVCEETARGAPWQVHKNRVSGEKAMNSFANSEAPTAIQHKAIIRITNGIRGTIAAGAARLKEIRSRARLRQSVRHLNEHLLQDVGLTKDDVKTLHPKFPSGDVDRTIL
jgi:uncharacterized protein YjiS (DUF1127 family)